MNYLIKIVMLILITNTILAGQKSEKIIVTGVHEWFEIPEKMTLEFSFIENGKTCGPNTEFETIGEQFSFLKFELLKNNIVASQIKEIEGLSDLRSEYPIQSYSYQYSSIEDAKLIHDMAKEAFAENFKLYHHFKINNRDEILEAKYLAIKNAIERAEIIANNLGYKNVIIISIDEAIKNHSFISPKANRKTLVGFETKVIGLIISLDVVFNMN